MAIITAAATGNFNATGTWTGGVVPVGGDIAVANGKTITITANIGSSGSLITLDNGITNNASAIAGGGFVLNGGLTIYVNILTGTAASCLTTAGVSPTTATINGGTITGGLAVGMYGVNIATTGNLTINANFATATNATSAHCIIHNSTGLLTISGTGTGGTGGGTGALIYIAANSASLNLTGNITAGTGAGIVFAGSYATIPHQIVGNILGGSAASAYGLNWNAYTHVFVSGNVTGGSNATSYGAFVNVSGNIPTFLVISGTCKGGSAAHGVFNSGNNTPSVVTMSKVQGGDGTTTHGAYNSSAYVTFRASQFQHGAVGMPPYFGYCSMLDASISGLQNQMTIWRGASLGDKTLYDATAISGLLPAAADVRSGTSYNNGLNTGTMAVPAAAAVKSGVSVDNTTGTATLTADLFWNYLTSNSLTSGSFGERLANAATVATTGQQIADAKG